MIFILIAFFHFYFPHLCSFYYNTIENFQPELNNTAYYHFNFVLKETVLARNSFYPEKNQDIHKNNTKMLFILLQNWK